MVKLSDEDVLVSKMNCVIDELKDMGSVLVALSGGVDSSLVAKLAHIALGERAVSVTTYSKILAPEELEGAKHVAQEIGIKNVVVEANELSDLDFASNNPDRCYFCKKILMKAMKEVSDKVGIKLVVDGTNYDDLKEDRPGVSALREGGVVSPLVNAGFSKDDVRALARMLGLSVSDKPSMACLSSRVTYGEAITENKLERIARAEEAISSLVKVRQLRVRLHGEIARIEVGRDERKIFFNAEVMDEISSRLRTLGFTYVTFDLQGYRSGSMNEWRKQKDTEETKIITILPSSTR